LEDSGQRTENREQRTENREQRIENRDQQRQEQIPLKGNDRKKSKNKGRNRVGPAFAVL
jgi:hypothetical protein